MEQPMLNDFEAVIKKLDIPIIEKLEDSLILHLEKDSEQIKQIAHHAFEKK
ncbi:hypothetical protein [Spiroplasma poulsonii]|uniref:hypothetical protein n=1 Tax=Spiroplasma poulsonii TaxID=2138 RepID=UPI001F4CDFA2|nr:hypothetical protein [Spiroplasma poulsonii]UNF61620.1 hypothetical protein MNU24_06830 [Spiroplasma poulsonii]